MTSNVPPTPSTSVIPPIRCLKCSINLDKTNNGVSCHLCERHRRNKITRFHVFVLTLPAIEKSRTCPGFTEIKIVNVPYETDETPVQTYLELYAQNAWLLPEMIESVDGYTVMATRPYVNIICTLKEENLLENLTLILEKKILCLWD